MEDKDVISVRMMQARVLINAEPEELGDWLHLVCTGKVELDEDHTAAQANQVAESLIRQIPFPVLHGELPILLLSRGNLALSVCLDQVACLAKKTAAILSGEQPDQFIVHSVNPRGPYAHLQPGNIFPKIRVITDKPVE